MKDQYTADEQIADLIPHIIPADAIQTARTQAERVKKYIARCRELEAERDAMLEQAAGYQVAERTALSDLAAATDEAATLRRERDEAQRDAESREALYSRGVELLRSIAVALNADPGELEQLPAEAATLRVRLADLTSDQTRDRIIWHLTNAHFQGRPGAVCQIADEIMAVLRKETGR